MIFTIIDSEVKISKFRELPYYLFTLLDDYEHKHFARLAALEHTIKKFHKKNGIYFGDKEPFAKDYIGKIISAEIEDVQWANRIIKNVRLV